jgi:hypothetical protein
MCAVIPRGRRPSHAANAQDKVSEILRLLRRDAGDPPDTPAIAVDPVLQLANPRKRRLSSAAGDGLEGLARAAAHADKRRRISDEQTRELVTALLKGCAASQVCQVRPLMAIQARWWRVRGRLAALG